MSMRFTILLLTVPLAAWAMQLPPDMEADRYLLQAENAIEEQDFERAKTTMDRILELQALHDLELPVQFSFRYAQVLERLGLYDEAMESATSYLTLAGRDGDFYREALQLINAAEAGKAAALEAAEAARVAAEAEAKAAAEAATRLAGEARMFDGMEFVWIPPGEFRMGSTSSETDDDEQPVTQVRISRGFWLGKYEVTQSAWQQVMGWDPSEFSGCGLCPVEQVSWYAALDFIQLLNAQTGTNLYRLPTEAEWEFAARAGTTADRYGDVDEVAWHWGNSDDRTQAVGLKAPNAWGLYDMLGNAWEWVADWYGAYPGNSLADPEGPATGTGRAIRGGGWNFPPSGARASNRAWEDEPGYRGNHIGFRLARTDH